MKWVYVYSDGTEDLGQHRVGLGDRFVDVVAVLAVDLVPVPEHGLVLLSPVAVAPTLVLLAPDGLTMNPWYWLATQTKSGRAFFRFTMAHPHWLFGFLRAANKFKWVNPGIYKFTHRYIDDEKVRSDLYARWTTMRGFRPDLRQLRNTIRKRNIPVHLFYGRYDRIIRAKRGERFRKGIEVQCHLQLLPTGHQLLQPEHLNMIVAAITS